LSEEKLPVARPPRSWMNVVLGIAVVVLIGAIAVTGYLIFNRSQAQNIPQTMTEVQILAIKDQLKKTPNDASLYLGLASAYYGVKQYDDATDALDKLQSINPTGTMLASLMYARGKIAEQKGDQEAALQDYQKSIDVTDTLDARYALGVLYLNRKQFADSVKNLERFVAAQPDDASVLRQLAAAYEGAGDKTNALKTYEKAYKYDPTPETLAEIKRLKGQQ
jgi:tetratricopeptide (TPR) repeat protein